MNETKLTTWEKIKVFHSDYVPAVWEEIKTFYDGYVMESFPRIVLYIVPPVCLLLFTTAIIIFVILKLIVSFVELIYSIVGSSSLTFAVIFTPIILVIAIVEYKAIRKFYKEKRK